MRYASKYKTTFFFLQKIVFLRNLEYIYFALGFKKFARKTKSAVTWCYEMILHVVDSHPIVPNFFYRLD